MCSGQEGPKRVSFGREPNRIFAHRDFGHTERDVAYSPFNSRLASRKSSEFTYSAQASTGDQDQTI